MLKRSVDQMKKTWPTSDKSRVVKRSTRSQAGGLILNSLDSYCINFKSDPDINKYLKETADLQPLSSRDISGFTPFKSNKNSRDNNMKPDVFPTQVLAERENDKLWLIFQIAHSDSAMISRIDPFHFKDNFLEMPEDSCKTVVSKARFEIDASSYIKCNSKSEGYARIYQNVEATFQMTSQKDSHYRFTAYVDVCRFDLEDDEWNGGWQTKYEILSEIVYLPEGRLIPNIGDSILIEKGVDLQIDLMLEISLNIQYSIRLVLWDWTQNKTFQSAANIPKMVGHSERVEIEYENKKDNLEELFTVEIINATRCLENQGLLCTSVRIILNTGSGTRSGKLFFKRIETYTNTHRWRFPIVGRAALERTILVKLPDEPQDVPEDLIYLGPKQRFLCNEYGDVKDKEGYNPFGKNCTVMCQAFGRDISSIYITSLKPIKSPVKLSSHILSGRAVAILDVGPSSESIDGGYRCTAVDIRGQTRTQELKLVTHLFTEVKSIQLGSKGNEATAIVTCTAYGEIGLNLSIIVSNSNNNETRLDIDDRYERNITTNERENTTTLTLVLPWEELRLPRNLIRCFARSERGDDSKDLGLSSYDQNGAGIVPNIDRNSFYLIDNKFGNNTATLTCTATGLLPIEVSIDYDDFVWHYRREEQLQNLNENPLVIKSTKTDENSVTVTYENVPLKVSSFKCLANNKYGHYRVSYQARF